MHPKSWTNFWGAYQSISLPMFIYNIPALSGVTLSVDNISEFLKSDKFAGVKYTSSDFFGMERIKTRHRREKYNSVSFLIAFFRK